MGRNLLMRLNLAGNPTVMEEARADDDICEMDCIQCTSAVEQYANAGNLMLKTEW